MPVGRPERLRAGDVVGVVAPAGVVDAGRLERGVRILEGWGLQVVTGESVLERCRYLAGSYDARRRDLQRMLDDPGIRAVLAARGGFGSQRIVPGLDLGALRRTPKPVVGFSDVTALLAAVAGSGGGAPVHGPMVAADLAALTPRSAEHFRRLLADPGYRWDAEVPGTIVAGRASGPLVGGCLAVIASLLGTPWAPDTRGTILFLEDVNEPPYRLDRLLTQLAQAGVFDGVAGVVFGTLTGCAEQDGCTALDVVREAFASAPFPVGFGLAAGHHGGDGAVENLALPLGTPVELDTACRGLRALEPTVV